MVKYRSLEKILNEGGVTERPRWKEGREHFLQIAERYKEGEPADFPSGGVSPSQLLSLEMELLMKMLIWKTCMNLPIWPCKVTFKWGLISCSTRIKHHSHQTSNSDFRDFRSLSEEEHITNLIETSVSPSAMLISERWRTSWGYGLLISKQWDFQFGKPLFVHRVPRWITAWIYSAPVVTQVFPHLPSLYCQWWLPLAMERLP